MKDSFLYKILICSFLVALGVVSLEAQSYEAESRTKKEKIAFTDSVFQIILKNTLIVALPSYNKKISALEQIINDPTITKSKKRQSEKILKYTLRDRDRLNPELAKAFYDLYKFSDFVITYDSSLTHIKNGIKGNYFLDKNLEIDSSIVLKPIDYGILRFGNDYANQKRGLILTDKNIVDTVVHINAEKHYKIYDPFTPFILSLFHPNYYPFYKGDKIVKKIEARMDTYFLHRIL